MCVLENVLLATSTCMLLSGYVKKINQDVYDEHAHTLSLAQHKVTQHAYQQSYYDFHHSIK